MTNLEIVLVELNSVMIGRALALAQELGLKDRVRAEQADLNTWRAHERAEIYFATHSLHHVVELEHPYDEVAESIDSEGVMLVNDMIGRNGHVRWPGAQWCSGYGNSRPSATATTVIGEGSTKRTRI